MKLRNKKTGEIVEVESLYLTQTQELYLSYINEENKQKVYMTDKIASFNLDWEDYEEPKEWWYIDIHGPHNVIKNDKYYQVVKEASKEIGNYFETKEEAERVVEKLKAWKRLKEANIDYKLSREYDDFTETMHANVNFSFNSYPLVGKDLDLLFGGEE